MCMVHGLSDAVTYNTSSMAVACPLYTVRKATRPDVLAIKKMIDIEKWDHFDLNYLYCVYDLDDRAWFVAEADNGEIIGVRALAYFNDTFTAGGVYIVKKNYRGYGVGRAINAAALKSVGDSNVIISANNVDLYNTRGFTHDYNIHHKRLNVGKLIEALPVCQLPKNVTIKPHTDDMLSDVIQYDADICKHDRSGYVKNWNIQTSELVLVAFTENASVAGYGCLRMTEYGYQVAPLYADTKIIAWPLLRGLSERVDRSNNIDLFVCSENGNVIDLLKNLPHENVVTLHKMYNRNRVEMPLGNVYSLSTMTLAVL